MYRKSWPAREPPRENGRRFPWKNNSAGRIVLSGKNLSGKNLSGRKLQWKKVKWKKTLVDEDFREEGNQVR